MRCSTLFLVLILAIGASPSHAAKEVIGRADLLQDTRELMRTVESVHPDPYLRAGGKIALHRLFQEILGAIPAEGLNRDEYIQLLQPLLAAVGDGHTAISDAPRLDPYSPGGIPLYLEPGADCLYVLAVLDEAHRELIGARLVSVEGVEVNELLSRYSRIRATDNISHLRRQLAGQGALWYGVHLRRILPEWQGSDRIAVGLVLADGSARALELRIPASVDYGRLIMPPISDPALLADLMGRMQRSDIFYRFLDPERQTCLLVIHSLATYREAFEVWHAYGIGAREAEARALYQRFTGKPAPEPYQEVLAGLPSATEIFAAMREEMDQAGTRDLLVDLSQNDGGSSVLSHILIWSLYGRQAVLDVQGRATEITKYSPELFVTFPSPGLEEINAGRPVPLTAHDYDLSGDLGGRGSLDPGRVREELDAMIRRMPTFAAAWSSGRDPRPAEVDNVLVLVDSGTYSAAFFLMNALRVAGAETAGIPSAQAGNCFGDIMRFTLGNTGVRYTVSRKYFELFPGDPERGRLLMPDHVMDYDTMAGYDFDPLGL